MAYRQLYSESAFATPGTDRFEFAVPTNGSTTPVATGIRGSGATITRTGVGIMTVIFGQGMVGAQLLSVQASLRLSAVGNTIAQAGTWTPSTRTLLINCINSTTGAAAEWPAANANNVLHIDVVFADSATLPNRGG
jgi:hypothetical protein